MVFALICNVFHVIFFYRKVPIQKPINRSSTLLSHTPFVSAGKYHSAVLTDVNGLVMFGCGIQGQTGWDFVTQLNSGASLSYPCCLLPSAESLHLSLNGLCKPLLTTGQLLLNPSENTEMTAIHVACGASVSVVLADLRSTSSNTVSYQNTFRQYYVTMTGVDLIHTYIFPI
ncbi:uncharacterized protein DEA37_0012619 [Paragonimus westermani]|uniref:Uncharacterized protein n=1 Tax=Paragonimus westermani TaxID=34504 RepID=A0A5J4NRJ5_9TREM|nr:uncharacterized protein DEA37_0012619 [Paragonimus westermani]